MLLFFVFFIVNLFDLEVSEGLVVLRNLFVLIDIRNLLLNSFIHSLVFSFSLALTLVLWSFSLSRCFPFSNLFCIGSFDRELIWEEHFR
jgi:hypothetical protein